jgi:uncharacterized protein (TIGR03067 family)
MNDGPAPEQATDHVPQDIAAPPPVAGKPLAPNANTPSTPPAAPDSRIQSGSIRLFRVAGIDVLLHWSWFLFAILRLQTGTSDDDGWNFTHYHSQIWYLVEYLALFGIVLLHEFGHVLACRSVGGIANRIVLWPLGGVAFVDPPNRPVALLWSIAAGPLVNVLLLLPTIGFWLACRAAGLESSAPDVYRFVAGIAWINAWLLIFNMLPVYPLDGGRILEALLWFVIGRPRSTLVATAIGFLTALGLLILAIINRSLVWGIMAGFGVLFSFVGFQGARMFIRMQAALRRTVAACPACGHAPAIGKFWVCQRCLRPLDVFASGGICPNCSEHITVVRCLNCAQTRPFGDWQLELPPLEPPEGERPPGGMTRAPSQPASAVRPVTVGQRVVWATIFAFFALTLCGLPNVEKQPLGLIVWTVAGAILGARSAGAMTRGWKNGRARDKLRGTWRLVAEDGQDLTAGEQDSHTLILSGPSYKERAGDQAEVRGFCWIDSLAEPPAISLTSKAGPDACTPRPGIYRLEDDDLTISLARPGHPRPIAFVVQPDVQQLRVYRKGGKAKA